MVDDEFEDDAFEDGEEDVADDADDLDEIDELDEEFDDDDEADDDLALDDDVDVPIAAVADDDDLDDDDEEEEVELEEDDSDDDDDDDEEKEILGFGEKALAEDELLDFVDDSKEDLGVVTVPIGEGEFTCRSCYLVKRRAQLADEKKMICLDCG